MHRQRFLGPSEEVAVAGSDEAAATDADETA